MACRAVYLDRDGVLVEDVDLLRRPGDVRLLEGVGPALAQLKEGGFKLIIVSNQTVVARGLMADGDVMQLQRHIEGMLVESGAPRLDAFYYCPHHPKATLLEYREECECRKPFAGMLLESRYKDRVDLESSFLVGDRMSDIAAGHLAGCKTVLVETGKHNDPAIETTGYVHPKLVPDFKCSGLPAAATWILAQQ